MPTLFKRSNGIYYIVCADDCGKRKWVSTHERLKSQAVKKLLNFGTSTKKPGPRKSLQQFTTEFLSFAHEFYSPGTVGIYKKTLGKFLNQVGDLALQSITPRHVDLFRENRLREVSRTTVNIELRTLRAAFYTAQRWKMMEENPLEKVALCKIEEKAPCFLSLAEFRELHSAVKEEWLRDMMVLAALSGMRRGEILNLKWQNVDLRNGLITIQSSVDFKTKGGKKRVVPMNRGLVEMFERRLRQNGEELVFALEGRKISRWWVSRRFKRYVLKLGLDDKLHFHSLRHSFATWLVQDGASIYEVQKLLGHSSIKTTEIYSHLVSEQLHKTVNRIRVSLPPGPAVSV